MDPLRRLLDNLAGPITSRELQQRLGLSQSTVSRLLGRAGPEVVRLGRGPTTRYARAVAVFGTDLSVPLFAVNETGLVEQIATLKALASGAYLVEPNVPMTPSWLLGNEGTGLFESLPYFLHDLRPAGFIGRQIARSLADEWGVSADPRVWNDRQIGRYLLERGHDLPGNLVMGQAAAQRVNRADVTVVDDRGLDYPRLASRALDDQDPGSSAAGEQPKFAVCHREAGHVIVKFSPAGTSAEALRWRDLLRAEHHALARVADHGIQVAPSTLHDIDGRCFLESRRFDRRGERGRSAAISLAMVDAEFVGQGHGWTRVARALVERRLLDEAALRQIGWLETFGGWIGNSDLHLYNISLAPRPNRFALLPVYDMLPMAYAPVRGEIRSTALRPPIRTLTDEALWRSAGAAAIDYWSTLADDDQLSSGFRALSREQARRCREVLGA